VTTDPPPDQDPAAPKRFLTLDEVATELNVSRSQTYALVRGHSLLGVKIGGRGQWRVERCQLEQYIDQLYINTANSANSQVDDPAPSGPAQDDAADR